MDGITIDELGVCVQDFSVNEGLQIKAKSYNNKLKIFREFSLATLSTVAEAKSKQLLTSSSKEHFTMSQVYALDALACTGIAGIQWKKHLSGLVHVTMAEHGDIKRTIENAETNSLTCTELKLNPMRVPGDLLHRQDAKVVHICQADAKTVMMMEAFNFIYLSPSKNCSSYLEPALHSITSDGFLCLVVPDVSLFARSPHVVQRSYSADIVKTEYLKELAARIVLGSLARAAARYTKGITPQYVLSHEDYLLICVKINRGNNVADSSIHEIEKLLHCRLCEERTFIPNQLAPIEDPYSLLACSCKKNNPGKTAVILGPAWKGPLSDPDFLSQMHKKGKQLNLSTKFLDLVHLIIKESLCAKTDIVKTFGFTTEPEQETAENNSEDRTDVSIEDMSAPCGAEDKIKSASITGDSSDKMEAPEGIDKVSGETHLSIQETEETTYGRKHEEDQHDHVELTLKVQKRQAEDVQESSSKLKRRRKDTRDTLAKTTNVPFYYSITKFKKTNLPKLDKLVTILHCRGHRASRTHFDSCAIRTSASIEEFLQSVG